MIPIARLLAVALLIAGCSSAGKKPAPVGIKAHRGASAEAPENTLAAARLAWRQGAGAVEIDVRLSADRVPVVIHDETTARTGGRDRPVAAQSFAELRELDVGAWKAAAFAGERIPTLAEVIAAVPAGRTLFVEIKVGVADLAPILAVIGETPCRGQVAIESSRLEVLRAVRARGPTPPVHWTVHARRDQRGYLPHPASIVDTAVAERFAGLALDARGLDRRVIAKARSARLVVGLWTVDAPDVVGELRAMGLDWIETNRVREMVAAAKD
jgi:glycerophosphoryl diester phosphodiesterase